MPKSKPRVILDRRARDNLKKIPGNTRQAIIAELNALACSPRPAKSKLNPVTPEKVWRAMKEVK